ncbi:hypothetical protein [Luteibacter yeojuensis]|uniref:DUF4189 domain-containing protein n=1 Tax=Luteibacter yeojuensis TaxID=345309 RepID=A0A0F3L2L4_9GAMM|nr:hypothetical protein [Luteibacter yeojuensis]KJV36579.1 hypothetical protein VI08_04330 [Luteibacter yeojuensis]
MRLLPIALLCLVATPACATITCNAERYVFGNHHFPSHDEAMAQCLKEEASMTHAETGAYEHGTGCHDVGAVGEHDGWRYGRVATAVIARESGETYTFEGLWMCKPVAD